MSSLIFPKAIATKKNPDIRQSKSYALYIQKQGWIVERLQGINYFIKQFPIVGSFLKIQRTTTIDLGIVESLQNKYNVFQTTIEPDPLSNTDLIRQHNLLIKDGFNVSATAYLPTRSMQLDLTKDSDQIFRDFSKECRYSIKRGEGLKLKHYKSPNEIKDFHHQWKKSVGFDKHVPSYNSLLNLKNSFPQSDTLFVASHNKSGRITGGAIFTTSSHGSTHYWQGFTNKEGRTSLSQYTVLHYGILWGKSMGCKLFDFEGIYDSRFPNKSWLGFTQFKRQFGGLDVLYPGCYSKTRKVI